MFRSLEMFKQTQQEKDSDARYKAQKDELEAMLKRVHEVIQAFDNQWLANDYVILDDLIWVLAKANSVAHDTHKKVIQEAVINDALAVWDAPIEKQYKLNASIRQTGHLPDQTLVLKKDLIHWWQQTQAVPLPQRLLDLYVGEIKECDTSHPKQKDPPKKKTEPELIKNALIELGYTLMELPVSTWQGGAKAQVRAKVGHLFTSDDAFDTRWKKILNVEIAYKRTT